jgi:hypothetical protein
MEVESGFSVLKIGPSGRERRLADESGRAPFGNRPSIPAIWASERCQKVSDGRRKRRAIRAILK